MSEYLLEVKNLTRIFTSKRKKTVALKDVSLAMERDNPKTLAVVGESGSGKSTLANHILGFLKPTSGQVLFEGKDINRQNRQQHKQYRQKVQAIFQNPFDTFNPFYKVDHVFHMLVSHFHVAPSRKKALPLIEQALEMVRLNPGDVLGKYSHQLSGGQQQRIMIARCLLLKPKLLIADEPVSMIDASLRVTVLDVMEKIKTQNRISQLYITHDLSTALQISDDIIVMYKGHIVEKGPAIEVIQSPAHPYTQLLIQCIPLPSPEERWKSPIDIQDTRRIESEEACCFCDRCPKAADICFRRQPGYTQVSDEHSVACYLYGDKTE